MISHEKLSSHFEPVLRAVVDRYGADSTKDMLMDLGCAYGIGVAKNGKRHAFLLAHVESKDGEYAQILFDGTANEVIQKFESVFTPEPAQEGINDR
jgi:hypothetical protein